MNEILSIDEGLRREIEELGRKLVAKGWMCGTAESCTGGLVGAACTSVPGASQWFAGGVIAYANAVKVNVLGVEAAELEQHGAVSEAVVRQMAAGACATLGVQAAVSISGVAGPGGGTALKPVGTVWLGFCVDKIVDAEQWHFFGNREEIRALAVAHAARGLLQRL